MIIIKRRVDLLEEKKKNRREKHILLSIVKLLGQTNMRFLESYRVSPTFSPLEWLEWSSVSWEHPVPTPRVDCVTFWLAGSLGLTPFSSLSP